MCLRCGSEEQPTIEEIDERLHDKDISRYRCGACGGRWYVDAFIESQAGWRGRASTIWRQHDAAIARAAADKITAEKEAKAKAERAARGVKEDDD